MAGKKRMPVDPLASDKNESQMSDVIEDIVNPEQEDIKSEVIEPEVLQNSDDAPEDRKIIRKSFYNDTARNRKAKNLILRNSAFSAATGLIPVPYLDTAVAAAVQLEMLSELSRIYGVPFKEDLGKKVLTSLLGAVIPVVSAKPLANILNFIPVVGTLKGIILISNAALTYAIGMAFMTHYKSGGTLLTVDTEKMKNDVKGFYKKGPQTA
ncbi:MAG: hypothetical protein C0602_06400 [Denitrovibrio sp.]|nr:MAG: hypothetical protein C0602_06400 [Denitrovibrio sp.]